jgi:1,4-alpha-glucan branching enzyme
MRCFFPERAAKRAGYMDFRDFVHALKLHEKLFIFRQMNRLRHIASKGEMNMIIKDQFENQHLRKVTFELPAEMKAKTAHLCGDFNEWSRTSHPMDRCDNGSFRLTLSLKSGQRFRFRYFLDGERWENDWDADSYIKNVFGSEDSVVET